jgi:hypothetical protein
MATTTNFDWETPDDTDLVKDGAAAMRTLGSSIDTSMADLLGGTTGQVLAKNSDTDMDFVWSADAAGMTNPMTTTADIIYSSSGSTPARLGIGSTSDVLTVAGGVPTWAAPAVSPSGLTLITTQAISGVTSQSINNCFSATYQNYQIVFSGYCATSSGNPTFKLRVSGTDSTASYYSAYNSTNYNAGTSNVDYTNNGGSWSQRPLGTLDSSSTSLSGTTMTIYSPFAATNTAYTSPYVDARIGTNNGAGAAGGVHAVATSYDGFTITNATAMTGTVRVYGLAN